MSESAFTRPANAIWSLFQPAFDLLLGRNRTSAAFRFVLIGASFVVYWFVLVWLAGFPGEIPLDWQDRLPSIAFIVINTIAPFFHPQVLIHLLPVVFAILVSFFIASLYLTDLFELQSFWIAASYLFASLFGLGYPKLSINRGDMSELEGLHTRNPLLQIGGPGYVIVHLGYAAVFETEDGIPKVYGSPRSGDETTGLFIEGFERLRGVIDLRDQLGKVDEVRAVTRDGIEVYARDAQMLFRVYGGDQQRSLKNPYPFTKEGIRRLIYGQAVKHEGESNWVDLLPEIVSREIRSFVSQHSIQEFLALQPSRQLADGEPFNEGEEEPKSLIQIPRRQLTEHFHTDQLRERLRNQGLELAWVGVGTWEMRDDQRSSTPGETGPAKTLTATWRDLQRSNLYSSADYQAREYDRCLHERTAEGIGEIIKTWKHGELPRPYRCFETLYNLQQQMELMLLQLENESDLNPPPDIVAALNHIRFLIRSREIGEDED
ncbi:MAG: hypothetical protein AMJ88_03765 [Anaerolineae bacterium SM23_ 63]|nr:MAG: hypothetical protein AMJ88_03765 [Anaerolineae bacterium SM23_ 63]